MTALLTRLRIAGFKSFAEPATVDILPGLTGIVGPNGCGKSNVVEALRWAMGETSVRSLRGGEMDDVIFAGTSARASRNLAEVTITLQRGETAPLPEPFAAEDELQVTRRIERGAGSSYRGNGREMRARDVQTLFADLASGAHSSAMVSQGKVSALVNAKPEARRVVLEEAAGITGLHARRHEAELKLRAAEANMSRAEELRTQLDQSRESLRKQAKQATRFRNISSLVRAAETEFLAVQHGRAAAALAAAEQAQAASADAVAAALAASEAASQAVIDAEAALPAPRAAEAAARSVLERRRLEAESLTEEAARAARALEEAHARLALIDADLADAAGVEEDARATVERLAAEHAALTDRLHALPTEIAAAEQALAAGEAGLRAAEHEAEAAARRAAEAEAAARQAALALAAAETRVADSTASRDSAAQARDEAVAALIAPDAVATASEAASTAEAAWANTRAEAEAAAQTQADCVDRASRAKAAAERAAAQAEEAHARVGAAQARLARAQSALADLRNALAAAEAARVPEPMLAEARATRDAAAADTEAAEQAALAAEQAQGAAAAAALTASSAHDSARAEHARLTEARAQAAARRQRLDRESATLSGQLAAAEAALIPADRLTAAHDTAAQATAAHEAAVTALRQATAARAAADSALAHARAAAATAAAEAARAVAEADGLRAALAGQDDAVVGLLDSLQVPPGLEAAVGAAFAHAAGALDERESGFWRALPPIAPPAWPTDATPFSQLLTAPPELARVLAHTALLPEGADGDALQAGLHTGCTLVAPSGALWRWDGQVLRAGAPSQAAARLKQRARLRDVERAVEDLSADSASLSDAQVTAEHAAAGAIRAESAARAAHDSAESALADSRAALAAITAAAERAEAGRAALLPAVTRLAAEQETAAADAAAAETALAALDDVAALASRATEAAAAAAKAAHALTTARATRESARTALAAADAALRRTEAAASEAENRVAALTPQTARLEAEQADAQAALRAAEAETASLPDLSALRAEATGAVDAVTHAAAALAAARTASAAAEHSMREAAASAARLERAAADAGHALAARETVLARAEADLAREQAARDAAHAAIAALPDTQALAQNAAEARQSLAETRQRLAEATAAHAELTRALANLQTRAPALAAEKAAWTARETEAARRRAALAQRRETAAAEVDALNQAPLDLEERAVRSGAILDQATADHAAAAAALHAAEQALRAAAQSQRDGDAQAAACREAAARGEGALETAAAALAGVLERALERLGPEAELPQLEDLSDAAEERARRKQDRLIRERDEMGPVNLRADIELEELDGKIADIDRERDELTTAIAKLRGSIGHLNREGRERLAAVFTEVDTHFRTLFTRMMGGGRAHLALTGSDDPLEAGLEIYAEPPGKKLSTLSLLSGGEQALTALSLIFAVFRCTPAPVAVLDEVDAPLDDANVDRFCSLLEDVVRDTGTRFLVVTHHQLTMSRMDRLYGVTMQERGVSRLLSVDLRRAAEMVEQPSLSLHAAE